MKVYIGLDAHSRTCSFVTINGQGQEVKRAQVKTTENNIISYVKMHKGDINLALEESFIAQWLYTILKNRVNNLVICNPIYISKKTGAKTDFIDAKHLALELRSGNLVPVYHEDNQELLDLKKLVSSYLDLIKDSIRIKNRLKSYFYSRAIPTEGNSIFNDEDSIFLLEDSSDQYNFSIWQEEVQRLHRYKLDYHMEFRKIVKEMLPLQRLSEIPGIDCVRSCVILAYTGGGNRFPNKHRYWSYCGLVRHKQISDGKNYGLSKSHGRNELKWVFKGAAHSVAICPHNSVLKEYYEALLNSGKNIKLAKQILARKIAAIALMILKNEVKFNTEVVKNEIKKIKNPKE